MVVQDVIKAVTVMFAAYGQSKDTERIKIYCRMLKDVPKDMLVSVVQKAMLEYKYLPSIAELAEACRSLDETVNGAEVPSWGDAWREIERAMQATPWGHSPKFSSEVIADTVRQYGWHSLQTCLADDINTVRAQIRRMYDDNTRRYYERKKNTEVLMRNPALADRVQGVLERGSA